MKALLILALAVSVSACVTTSPSSDATAHMGSAPDQTAASTAQAPMAETIRTMPGTNYSVVNPTYESGGSGGTLAN